ncbi:Peptidyl-prolyl cis-trans isomerase D [Hondaea fermentalgiana]|uniref:Peptidyl-prolyl cis-trans isomerase D n=1 Tax=Hondaea fermentalgiana TaxID=2315210 RepID=A0A2R5FZM6_9STRA|nr:Peptidyl-prolyl cis-trans isomerase D [Hondaea fermentalgiana]|eukprot:GBG24212.1 Peptidyl-prolyl cis-trans isomerase D [Hondaea fermentalgiana]
MMGGGGGGGGGGSGGFQELLQQAAALKGEQVKAERRKFEAQPTFLQNTLFHCRHETVEEARNLKDVEARLEVAARFKDEGNALFAKGAALEASDMYERCIGCFWYIATSEPNFKEKGVKDEHLSYRQDFLGDERVKKLVATALVNAASCHQKFSNWDTCVQNCTHALDLDETNVKALYRRAQARTIPVSCGALDLDLAIKDLKRALALKADDRALRKMYSELVAQRTRQRESDKKTFTGIFERADLGTRDDESTAKPSARGTSGKENASGVGNAAEKEILMYKDVAASLRQQGRDNDAAQVEDAIAQAEESLMRKKILASNSFEQPTKEMIREAREEHGIDLTDPDVQAELQRQWERRAQGLDPAPADDADADADAAPQIREEMSDNRMTMYIVVVGVIATLIFSGIIPWIASSRMTHSFEQPREDLFAHEDEL